MGKFNHLSALEHLLKIETDIFKDELYYPWYVQPKGIQITIAAWTLSVIVLLFLSLLFSSLYWVIPVTVAFVLSVIFAGAFFALISRSKIAAQKESLKQMMALEKDSFIKNITPFVASDQKGLAKRIYNNVDFSAKEYTSLVIATKSRAILNTDAFIKDIERMFADETLTPAKFDDGGNNERVFKVPESAKKNYEKLKNQSTFSDALHITPQVQAGIMSKVREAANRTALGRD